MKTIPLSQNGDKHKGKYFAMVDDEDYDYLMQWIWYASVKKRNVYARRGKTTNGSASMHRLLMNPSSDKQVDHIDHNGLNNQKSNLRICTHSENQRNRRTLKKVTSKYMGVSMHKEERVSREGRAWTYILWHAQLNVHQKAVYSKYFKTEIEAALAYNEAAIKYHGEFATINKIK
jgi:hypothetical protein